MRYDHETVVANNPDALAHVDNINKVGGKMVVRFADRAFNSKLDMFMTMGHEYVHVSQFVSGLPYNKALFEFGAYQWNRNTLSNSEMTRSSWYNDATRNLNSVSRTPGINILKYGNHYNALTNPGWGLPRFVPSAIR